MSNKQSKNLHKPLYNKIQVGLHACTLNVIKNIVKMAVQKMVMIKAARSELSCLSSSAI